MTDEPTGSEPDVEPDSGFDAAGVPTFDSVRERIERRFQTSVGAREIDAATPEGRNVEQRYETRQREADERLAEIRESMRKDGG